MTKYCISCGEPIPDDQENDGYMEREQEEQDRQQQQMEREQEEQEYYDQ